MTLNEKLRHNLGVYITYFILISFLNPRGFYGVIPGYKPFFTLMSWISCLLIGIYLVSNFMDNHRLFRKLDILIAFNFALVVLITIIDQKGIHEGLQQMLAFPMICMFVIIKVRKNPIRFLDKINNILIILFCLNLVISKLYPFEYHATFLGHVQMIAQLGLLSIFTCFVVALLKHQFDKKNVLQLAITILNFLFTDAFTAIIVLVLCIGFVALFIFQHKFHQVYQVFLKKPVIYFFAFLFLDIVFIVVSCNTSILDKVINGRGIIWREAFSYFKSSWLLGYGIQGVLMKPFWLEGTSSNGFNYAHNQLVQILLDGGIVLLISMLTTFWFVLQNVKKSSVEYLYLVNATLITVLFLMIVDAPSIYCYIYMYISMIYALHVKSGGKYHGIDQSHTKEFFKKILSLPNKKGGCKSRR